LRNRFCLVLSFVCGLLLAGVVGRAAVAQPAASATAQTSATEATSAQPSITIHGKAVISDTQRLQNKIEAQIPASLADPKSQLYLKQRVDIPFYDHAPTQGDITAPITMVLLNDLSCMQCMDVVKKIEAVREKYKDQIYFVHVHLPVDLFNATNPAAFYGRLAHKLGLFWDYRARVIELSEAGDSIYLEQLLDLGVDKHEMRRLIREQARRLYKELDADAMLAQRLNENRPPVVYVNGIKVGEGRLLDKLGDVIEYELAMIKLGQRP
jgi:protein-disulfide isomerase